MNTKSESSLKGSYLLAIIILQVFIYLTVFLDIPIARQTLGFLYFTFVPGYIFVKLLDLSKINRVETLLLSTGFSVGFLMISGLLISVSLSMLGFSKPLSLNSLMLFLNIAILIGGIVAYKREKTVPVNRSQIVEKLQNTPFILLFIILPILSIIGVYYVNVYENNLILLFTIAMIAALVVGALISKRFLPSRLYPIAIVTIGLALLFHTALISNYIISYGSDVPWEYFVFKSTQNQGYWSINNPYIGDIGLGRYYSMLSITVLPTVYNSLLNMDQMLFKIVFPAIFSLVPLGLYQLWQGYVGKKFAFVAVFLFMSQATFYVEMISLNRQMIAELFFVLLLIVMFKKDMKPANKILCFMIFSFALVTSHYALAEILLFFVALTTIFLLFQKHPSRNITLAMVVFFFVLMFTWYIFTSGSAAFNSFLQFGDYVYDQLGNFLNPASRGETVLIGLGLAPSPSAWNTVSRIFAYVTQGFILLGFVSLLTKRSKLKIEREYFILSSAAILILVLLILVPGLANTLNMSRFFHILLFFLAPFFALGVAFLVRTFSTRKRIFVVSALLLLVLVPYFLFQTNFVYEVTGSQSWSVPLSGYRMNDLQLYGENGYLDARSAYGAQWLSNSFNPDNLSTVYADLRSLSNVLAFYGFSSGTPITNITIMANSSAAYLNTLNVVAGYIPYEQYLWNSSDISYVFSDSNVVYENGGSVIYQKP